MFEEQDVFEWAGSYFDNYMDGVQAGEVRMSENWIGVSRLAPLLIDFSLAAAQVHGALRLHCTVEYQFLLLLFKEEVRRAVQDDERRVGRRGRLGEGGSNER